MATLSRRTKAALQARERGLEAFLRATKELLSDGTPYTELSIDAIAGKAGFSRASFYLYFSDKRELLIRLGTTADADVYRVAGDWLADGEGSPREMLAGTLEQFRRHRAVVGALIEAATYDEEIARLWRGFHETFRDVIRHDLLRRHPQLDEDTANARGFSLTWLTERACFEHVSAPCSSDEQFLDSLALMWTAAYSAPGEKQLTTARRHGRIST